MFYAFSYTPSASDTEGSPYKGNMHLSAGIIHQVDIVFQDGCDHEEFVQIYDGKHQLWPTNPGEKLRGNATVVSFREFYELTGGDNLLTMHVWTTLSADFKEIIVQIGLLPKRVIQPLSFDELLSAAAGIE